MSANKDLYKERLVARFMELLDDFKCLDKQYVTSVPTSEIETIGKELAQAHKLLLEFKKRMPFMGALHEDKKRAMKRQKAITAEAQK